MTGVRILWLSPWMRPLARVQAEALRQRGHEVLLVTSDQHPESDAARDYELVLQPGPKNVRTWAPTARAIRTVRRFDADVVVAELVRDPRWIALAGGRPFVTVVHDDRPHDASEQRPGWERRLFDRWATRAAATVAHSHYVAGHIAAPGPVRVVPLTSDLDDDRVPDLVPAAGRRDVVLIGRLAPYKNVPVTLEAWQRHVTGPGWRGDDLVLIGAGDVPAALPPHVRVVAGRYRYADVVPTLSRAKAALAHYRVATQSGVQALALQLGVTTIVSPTGGLAETLPPGETPVAVDDVAGLAARFDRLADPDVAAAQGAANRRFYRSALAAEHAAAGWDAVLTDATLSDAGRAASTG